jgi:hypothetical protein
MSRRKKRTGGRPGGSRTRVGTARRREPAEVRRLKLRDPADLVGLVPYLLGFVPAESLVVVFVRGGRLGLTARMDLVGDESTNRLVEGVAELAAAHQPESIVALTYTNKESGREQAERITDGLVPYGLTESLLVEDRRWWSLTCTEGCCPAEGTSYELSTQRVSAEAVYAGLSVLPDREALQAFVAGPGEDEVDDLIAVVDSLLPGLPADRAARQQLMAQRVEAYLDDTEDLTDQECCRFALLGLDLHVRDVAWALMTREDAESHVRLWQQVVSRTPATLGSAPVCLLGMAAWLSGNGALVNFCVDRMADLEPGYTMTGLLADITDRALPPTLWDGIGDNLRAEVGLLAG